MTKRVIIIHGWGGHPNECWFPWLKNQLEKRKFKVIVPQMPDTDAPYVGKWVPALAKTIDRPDEDTYLVGHSVGSITTLRYLEKLSEKQKIGGVILVAGFTDDLGYKELSNFFIKPINWKTIRSHCDKFVAINSDDDQVVPLKHGSIFQDKLAAELIIEHGKRHMGESDKTTELPSVLDAILRISSD